MTIFLAILNALGAIPAIKDMLESAIAAWTASRLAGMAEDNRKAIKDAVALHDQRPIEEVIGNPEAGNPSGVPGSVFVPGPPPR